MALGSPPSLLTSSPAPPKGSVASPSMARAVSFGSSPVLMNQESPPLPITPDYGGPSVCYADGIFYSRFGRHVTVREDRRENNLNPTTMVVAIGLGEKDIQEPKVLISGNDFYAFPRMDPKGEKKAWIE
ncbi:hypothetical protein NL676_024995 [Syzygium grande]|nr:hypothetical protein NL676_024995 [Syzygium grande]